MSCFKCVAPDVTRICYVCLDPFSNGKEVIAHMGSGIKHPIHLECFEKLENQFSECLYCRTPIDLKSVKAKRLKIPISQEINTLKQNLMKETKLPFAEVNDIIESQPRYTLLHEESDQIFKYLFIPAFAASVIMVIIAPKKELWPIMLAVRIIFFFGVMVFEPYRDCNYRSYRRHEDVLLKGSKSIEGWKALQVNEVLYLKEKAAKAAFS